MALTLALATNWQQLEQEDDSNNVSIVTRMLSITLLIVCHNTDTQNPADHSICTQ